MPAYLNLSDACLQLLPNGVLCLSSVPQSSAHNSGNTASHARLGRRSPSLWTLICKVCEQKGLEEKVNLKGHEEPGKLPNIKVTVSLEGQPGAL